MNKFLCRYGLEVFISDEYLNSRNADRRNFHSVSVCCDAFKGLMPEARFTTFAAPLNESGLKAWSCLAELGGQGKAVLAVRNVGKGHLVFSSGGWKYGSEPISEATQKIWASLVVASVQCMRIPYSMPIGQRPSTDAPVTLRTGPISIYASQRWRRNAETLRALVQQALPHIERHCGMVLNPEKMGTTKFVLTGTSIWGYLPAGDGAIVTSATFRGFPDKIGYLTRFVFRMMTNNALGNSVLSHHLSSYIGDLALCDLGFTDVLAESINVGKQKDPGLTTYRYVDGALIDAHGKKVNDNNNFIVNAKFFSAFEDIRSRHPGFIPMFCKKARAYHSHLNMAQSIALLSEVIGEDCSSIFNRYAIDCKNDALVVQRSDLAKTSSMVNNEWRSGPSDAWFVEWDKALATAKRTGKKLFVLNTGSDWCHWCKKLKEDVLDKPEFNVFAEQNLVLLYLDSPSRNPLGKDQKMHNKLIVRALPFGGGVPSVSVFTVTGEKLGAINGGGRKIDDYLKRLKEIVDGKGEPVATDDAKTLFADGGYQKLLAKVTAERAKLPPVTKEDFKAKLTGVAVCDMKNRKFDQLEFLPPSTHLEVAKGKMAVFRVEHDFPTGYAAAVWVTGNGGLFSNPSGRYPGKGVKYGFLGLHDAKQDIRLNSIVIRTNSEPELDDYPRGWLICSPKVDLLFCAQDKSSAEKNVEGVQTAKANGYEWRYKLDISGNAILGGDGDDPCVSPRPEGKVVVPAEVNGHKVVAVGHMAFRDCPKMTEIVFPEGLEEIRGWYIFARCHGLTEVSLPRSMRRIGTWVFESCTNLRRVDLMNCEHADNGFGCNFIGCYALEEILCSKNNKAIVSVSGVLYSKDRKTLLAYPKARGELKILSGVREIANSALVSLPMKHVKIPEGIVLVGGCNFEYDWKGTVKEVVFPKSLRAIETSMFRGTRSVDKVVFCGDAPRLPAGSPFTGTDADIVVEVPKGSTGWNGPGTSDLPERWPVGAGGDSRRIRYIGEAEDRAILAQENGEPVKPHVSKSKLHAAYRSKDRKRVFVEVCHQHTHDSFKTPPYTLDRVREAIDLKADILFFTLARSKDGVLFSAERENIEHVSTGTGSFGDYTASQVKRMNVKHWGQVTAKHFVTLEDMIRIGKGKILFKVGGFREYAKDLEILLDKLDAWESVMVESWEVVADKEASSSTMWSAMCSGRLQVSAVGSSFADWKAVTSECTAYGGGEDLDERGLLNIPERVFEAFTNGPGKADRTDDEAGWEKALKEGVTVFRTNRPKELVKYLKKKRRR